MSLYETHVTVPMDGVGDLPLYAIASALHWTTAVINDDRHRFYFTTHALTLSDSHSQRNDLVRELYAHGVQVLRQKIEHIVFDTKRGDQ